MMVFRTMYPPSFHEYSVSLCAHCRLGKTVVSTRLLLRRHRESSQLSENPPTKERASLARRCCFYSADYSLFFFFFSCFRTFTSITSVVVLQLQTCKVHSRMCGKKSKNFTSFNQTDKIHWIHLLISSIVLEYTSGKVCLLSSKINSLWLTFRRCLCKTVSTVVSSTYLPRIVYFMLCVSNASPKVVRFFQHMF